MVLILRPEHTEWYFLIIMLELPLHTLSVCTHYYTIEAEAKSFSVWRILPTFIGFVDQHIQQNSSTEINLICGPIFAFVCHHIVQIECIKA